MSAADSSAAGQEAGTRKRNLGLVCLVVAAGFFLQARTGADPDLWGHVKFGQDLWRTGQLVHADTYSYLSSYQPWINHEWLSEAIFALAFDWAGAPGLQLVKGAIALFLMGLMMFHLRQHSFGALIVLVFFVFLAAPWLTAVRPQLFTYLFFLVLLVQIRAAEEGRGRMLWAAPVVIVLWTNTHGGFLAGVGLILAWVFLHIGFRVWRGRSLTALRLPSSRRILVAVVAAALATLLNPYGFGLVKFVLQTATIPRPDISEWQPIVIRSFYGAAYLLSVGVAVVGFFHSGRERNPVLVTLWIGAAILPLTAVRHTPLFALANAVFAGEHIDDAWNRWMARRFGPPASSRGGVLEARLGAIALAAAVVMVGLSAMHLRCIVIDPERTQAYPARAVALLRKSKVEGKLAIHFDWGEYAIWHLSPALKVSMDGRRETVYSRVVYEEFLDFLYGKGDWDAHLRRKEADLALVPKKFPVFNLMKLKPGWHMVYEDPLAGLFVRESFPGAILLKGLSPPDVPHDGKGSCFP